MLDFLKDAFVFPFRGGGKYILLIGGGLGLMQAIASLAPLVGLMAALLMLGYFVSMYFQIIHSTATGSDEAPDFPETSNIMEDLISPLCQVIALILLCFLPLFFFSTSSSDSGGIVNWLLLGLGAAYFPMAMLAVVVLGRFSAVVPWLVIPGIVSAGALYWIACLLLIALYWAEAFIMGMFGGSVILETVVAAFIGMYTLMANGRILGLIYREREEELNWL